MTFVFISQNCTRLYLSLELSYTKKQNTNLKLSYIWQHVVIKYSWILCTLRFSSYNCNNLFHFPSSESSGTGNEDKALEIYVKVKKCQVAAVKKLQWIQIPRNSVNISQLMIFSYKLSYKSMATLLLGPTYFSLNNKPQDSRTFTMLLLSSNACNPLFHLLLILTSMKRFKICLIRFVSNMTPLSPILTTSTIIYLATKTSLPWCLTYQWVCWEFCHWSLLNFVCRNF